MRNYLIVGTLLAALLSPPAVAPPEVAARLTPGARQALAPGGDEAAYLAALLAMERQGIAQYGALEPLLVEAGIRTPEARAALRAAAQAGVLTPAEQRLLRRVTGQFKPVLRRLGAGRETLAALDRYAPDADILRLGYLARMAEAEARVAAPSGVEVAQAAGLGSPADRAALRALPFRVLGPAQRRALLALRERWQSDLTGALQAGPVLMHKEVPAAQSPALLRPGSYWTWHRSVRGLGSAAEAYGQLALGYPGTGFAPGAPERYWITMPVDAGMARSFGVPLAGEAILMTTLPTGPAAWSFPSTMNGFAASLTGFIPEWTWRGETRPYPDGTRLSGRGRDGAPIALAVVKDGSWRKIQTYVERSIGE